ncbi:hypothetical protein EX30DRAFT_391924 [Ascodesmis nigricans]|uniref:COP9 signalosome complex subunit 3 n=1 Tax=Ascodesmis nigricans TaxID=341454 RepID=A0A4S2N5M6_9PEZI|nr:hypothetical protein EX30DRAFT_391924 [Ascodesmis nigricans]
MEQLVATLTHYPTAQNLSDVELDQQCKELLSGCLNNVPVHHLTGAVGDRDILSLLDPGINTLAYLFVLCAKLDLGGVAALQTDWRNVAGFLTSYDPRQIKYGLKEFRRTVERFVQFMEGNHKPIVAVKALKKAILRSSNPSTFSFMHLLFARACLKANCFRDALAVLDIDVFDFPLSKNYMEGSQDIRGSEVSYQDVLSYFLYGAMLYHGVKNWERAFDLIQTAVIAPGSGLSKIQVEAYKKYVLTGLLLNGKVPPTLKSLSPNAVRIYRTIARAYETFGSAFMTRDAELFSKEAALTADTFAQDGNSGLAQQCMEAFRHQQIIALKDTYVTLGVDEIAQKKFDVSGRGGDAGSKEETERVILGMIERGQIKATLSHSSPDPAASKTTVSFAGDATADAVDGLALEEQIMRIVSLSIQVKSMDRKMGISNEYLQFLTRASKGNGGFPSLMQMDPEILDEYGGGWGDDDDMDEMQDNDEPW